MSALNTAFDQAMADSKNLSERPDNATPLLKIYALYKQGSVGDNAEKNPASATSWRAPNGTPGAGSKARRKTICSKRYIDLINELG